MKATIAEWRGLRRMSQTDLAEAIGRTQKTISKWETGKCEPLVSDLYKMEKVFKLNPSDRILMAEPLTKGNSDGE